MAGPNTTGVPNTADYNLGRGALYFSTLNSGGMPTGYRHLGNCPDLKLTVDVEVLEHLSSLSGLKVLDKEVTISQKAKIACGLDEMNHENLTLFFSGSQAAHTNVAVAGFSEYAMIPDGELALGRWYDIRNAAGERAYEIDTGDLTMATSNGTPVPLVEGTDYTLDLEMGRIFILSTSSVVATAIAGNEDIDTTLAAEAGARDVNEVRGLTTTSVVGALKFVSENPADSDRKTEVQFHQVSLKAEGELSLIGDEYSVMNFTGAAESNTSADANSPTMTIRNVVPA